jgi:caa(3)-type oxidase subunit IV
MSADDSRYPSNVKIWVWLVALLAAGLLLVLLPLSRTTAVIFIFSIALVKAYLVVRHYMHMRSETLLISAIAGIPVILLIGMALALVPDIVFNR